VGAAGVKAFEERDVFTALQRFRKSKPQPRCENGFCDKRIIALNLAFEFNKIELAAEKTAGLLSEKRQYPSARRIQRIIGPVPGKPGGAPGEHAFILKIPQRSGSGIRDFAELVVFDSIRNEARQGIAEVPLDTRTQ